MKSSQRRRAEACGAPKGSADFNLSLVNRMAPQVKHAAKIERDYGLGAVSVAWHADSSLADDSAITVYSAHHPATQSNFEEPAPPPNRSSFVARLGALASAALAHGAAGVADVLGPGPVGVAEEGNLVLVPLFFAE